MTPKPPKTYRLTFPMLDLLPVRDALKTFTVRRDQRLHGIAPGDALQLRFGAYNAPVIIDTVVSEVLAVDMEALADHEFEVGDWLALRYQWLMENQPLKLWNMLEPKSADQIALAKLCEATVSDPFIELNDAVDGEDPRRFLFLIRWTLPEAERTPAEQA